MRDVTATRPGSLRAWLLAVRPRTLPAATAPIILGGAVALAAGGGPAELFAACLAVGLVLQIAANLANDYFDGRSGTDAPGRLGPLRVTQAGLLRPGQVRAGFLCALAMGAALGIYVVGRTGPGLLVLGAACLLGAVAYTAGPYSLSRLGLGELAAFVFFGPVACGGTYWVLRGEVSWAAVVAGCGPGLHAAALLAVNNLRDIVSDGRAGRRTLAVRFGERFARVECVVLLTLGNLVCAPLARQLDNPWLLAGLLLVPFGVPLQRSLLQDPIDNRLNARLAATARWGLLSAVTLSVLIGLGFLRRAG